MQWTTIKNRRWQAVTLLGFAFFLKTASFTFTYFFSESDMQKKQIELRVSTVFYVFLRFDLIESEQAFSLISASYLDGTCHHVRL